MRFDVKQAREFLKENGFVFSVRSYDYRKVSRKKVKGIGNVLVRKIKEVTKTEDIALYTFFSGFKRTGWFEQRGSWWNTIEKYCKGKRKYLYLVVVEDEI